MPARASRPPQVAVIGPGRLGLALAVALKHAGIRVAAFARRPGAPARKLSVPSYTGAGNLLAAIKRPSLIFITVPDRALEGVAASLAADTRCSRHWFAHTSGVQGAGALEVLRRRGAVVGAFHPLQSFGPGAAAALRFAGAFCALDARGEFETLLGVVARKLGMIPFRLRGGARPLYHLAAVLASNALVGLLDEGEQLLRRAGLPAPVANKLLLPLVRGTLDNVAAHGVAAALTGPVVRGDTATLRTHLRLLGGRERELYRALMRQVLDLALRSGRLKGSDAAAVKNLLA